MKYYFTLQYKRLYRRIFEFGNGDNYGINPFLGFAIIVLLFYRFSVSFFLKIEYAEIIYPIMALIIIGSLSVKDRNSFIRDIFDVKKNRKIRLFENLILSIPFSLFLIYKQEFNSVFIFLALSMLISQYNKIQISNFIIPTPFYKKPFEFIVGFRKTFWLFLIAYLITYISISVGNFNLGVFALILVYLTTMNFYSTPEPVFYIWIYSLNSEEFIKMKIKIALLYSMFLSLLITISLLFFYFSIDNLILIILSNILGVAFLITNLLIKYSYFPSNPSIIKAIIIGLSIMFPPLLLFVIPYYKSLSNKTLKNILK